MNKENFISEALCQHSDLLPYYVSRKLAERYQETAIIEGLEYAFDIEAFERDGQCEIVCVTALHNQIKTEWKGRREKPKRNYENAWLSVMWQDHLLDVILMTYLDDGCKSRGHWIIAETREIAENFLQAVCNWATEARGEILIFEDGSWCKSEKLYTAIKSASFDDLILPDQLKQSVIDDLTRFLSAQELYEKYGIPWKRGLLLIGPPGNGKTQMVRALVNYLSLPCLYIKSFNVHGEAETGIRRVFARARQIRPCLIVMEDIDSLITKYTRSFFLNELDGFAENNGIVVLATTNYPEKLDPAIIDRPSRFDRKYHFDLPAGEERSKYLQMWNAKWQDEMRLSESGQQKIVQVTEGFSFAYLKELVLSSLLQWAEKPARGEMDRVMLKRAMILRRQMKTAQKKSQSESKKDHDDES